MNIRYIPVNLKFITYKTFLCANIVQHNVNFVQEIMSLKLYF
jgi:hypothetical protein